MPGPDTLDYQIGVASGSMVKLESLATPVTYPKGFYRPYAEEKQLVSGLVRGVGYPVAIWQWDVIPRAERDMLRTFCPGQSANVYIRTKTLDSSDSYANFYAVMVWPIQDEQRDVQRRTTFKIEFRFLVSL